MASFLTAGVAKTLLTLNSGLAETAGGANSVRCSNESLIVSVCFCGVEARSKSFIIKLMCFNKLACKKKCYCLEMKHRQRRYQPEVCPPKPCRPRCDRF